MCVCVRQCVCVCLFSEVLITCTESPLHYYVLHLTMVVLVLLWSLCELGLIQFWLVTLQHTAEEKQDYLLRLWSKTVELESVCMQHFFGEVAELCQGLPRR